VTEVKVDEQVVAPVVAAPAAIVSSAGNISAIVNIVAPGTKLAVTFLIQLEIVLLNDPSKVDTRAIIVNTSLTVNFTRIAEIVNDDTKEMAFKDNAAISIERFQAFVNQPSVKVQLLITFSYSKNRTKRYCL
jgi:hypothetical protein